MFMPLDLYAAPQHVESPPTRRVWLREAVLALLRDDPCRILDANFGEYPFRNCLKKTRELFEYGRRWLKTLTKISPGPQSDAREASFQCSHGLFRQSLHALR